MVRKVTMKKSSSLWSRQLPSLYLARINPNNGFIKSIDNKNNPAF